MGALRRRFPDDTRTIEQITEHYVLERQLADRLRRSTREERRTLYAEVYSALYSTLPHHPRHHRRTSPEQARAHVDSQLRLLDAYLDASTSFVEIGAGDGSLSKEVSKRVKRTYAVEVSTVTARPAEQPGNMMTVQYDGCALPFAAGSVNVAFSNAVMEHLHPEDAMLQIQSIAATLAHGGHYIFYTPHRHAGPGDVSKYFDTVATGFHLKEYTFRELNAILKKVGFKTVRGLVWFRGRYRVVPLLPLLVNEWVLALLPADLRYRLAWHRLLQRLVQIRIVATKA